MKQVFTFLILLLMSAPNFVQDNASLNDIQILIIQQQYSKALQLINQQDETPELSFQKSLCYKSLGNNKPGRKSLTKLSANFPENTNYIWRTSVTLPILI